MLSSDEHERATCIRGLFWLNLKPKMSFVFHIWAATCDFQQYGVLTSVDSCEPVQPPFKLRNFKWWMLSSLRRYIFQKLLLTWTLSCINKKCFFYQGDWYLWPHCCINKDLWHFDRVSAYFSDAFQNFPMHKISLVSFWIGRLVYCKRIRL